jgi:hypothetical protein
MTHHSTTPAATGACGERRHTRARLTELAGGSAHHELSARADDVLVQVTPGTPHPPHA